MRVVRREFVTPIAVCLSLIASLVALRADRLHGHLVLSRVAQVVVVFVSSLAHGVDVTTVEARHVVRIWQQTGVDVVIHASARLLLVTVAGRRIELAKLGTTSARLVPRSGACGPRFSARGIESVVARHVDVECRTRMNCAASPAVLLTGLDARAELLERDTGARG
jgi:hypothetical protein